MTTARLNLFGAPRLERNGHEVLIPRRKALAMLAYLAVTGAPQSRDALAAMLWPDQDTSGALANLRRALGVLKDTVGEDLLQIDRAQVGLAPDADLQVDVAQFRSLLEIARADGHFDREQEPCASCLTALTAAVELVQGDFMAGFHLPDSLAFDDWQLEQAQSLRADFAAVLVVLASWQAQTGEFQQALEAARRWLALDPLHEPAHRLLMQLYAHSGQQAAANRQFTELTRLLDEELGIEPEAESVELIEAIRAGRLRPEAGRPGEARPEGGQSLENTGVPSGEHLQPPFPRSLSPLIGRESEVGKVLSLLLQPEVQLVTIAGFGGMGKSHLAVTVGEVVLREYAAVFPDGAAYVSLAGVNEISELPGSLADALGLLLLGEPDPLEEVCSFLQARRMLLVFDNFEQFAEEAAVLNRLLRCAPQVKLLVTSREPLALAAEWRVNLEGLTYPEPNRAGEREPGGIEQFGSVQLFLHTARQIRAGLELDEETRPCIARLCWLVSGMPLALNLAAAWLRIMSCREIVSELEYNLDLLNSSMRDLPERQRSIRVIIESTWAMLSPEEQQAFRSIAAFQGSFSVQAIREVTGATPFLLSGLVDKGLVQFVAGRRYVMHELVRQLAEEKLDQSGQAEAAAESHSRYYLNLVLAQQEKLNGQGAVEAIETIREDLANIRQAWVWAALNERFDMLERCYPVMAAFYEYAGLLVEGETLFERTAALMAGIEDPTARRVKNLLILRQHQFMLDRGQTQGFQRLLDPVAAEIESLGDETVAAELNFVRAYGQHLTGYFDDAIAGYRQAIDTFERQGRKRKLIDLYNWLGEVHSRKHQIEEAAEEYWRAYDHAVELGDERRQALSLSFIGGHHWYRDEFLEARGYFRRALDLFERIGDRLGICRTLNNVGYLNNYLGNFDEALGEVRRAIRIFEQTGATVTAAQAYDSLGETLFALGDFAGARREYQTAYDRMRANEQKYDEAFVLANIARLDAAEGDFARAEARLLQAIRMLAETGIHKEVAQLYGTLGGVYRRMGETVKAQDSIARSIAALREMSAPYSLAKAYLEQAELSIDRNELDAVEALVDDAARLAGQVGSRPVLVQAAQVRARWQAASGRSAQAAEILHDTLDLTATDLERGAVQYALWELTGNRSFAQAAIETYERLAGSIGSGEVLHRLESLRAAVAG